MDQIPEGHVVGLMASCVYALWASASPEQGLLVPKGGTGSGGRHAVFLP